MKRLLLFTLVATLFAACSKDGLNEVSGTKPMDEAPETLIASFEECAEDTRIQLNDEVKTVWTEGDLVSVFYRSDANQKWQYTGKTGTRVGELTRVDAGTATTQTTRVIAVYPYNANYYFNTEAYNVQASLPAVQTYMKDSYGLNGNILVSSGEYNQISLKSVCGWLRLQLTGEGEKVRSITLRGNNGEQVAGELYINTSDATAQLASAMGDSNDGDGDVGGAGGNLVFEDTTITEVVLDCGTGVELGAEATAFYIALPPQTFENGFTVEIEAMDGSIMTKSTDKTLTIERNHIQPMAAFAYTPSTPANNEIWYTAIQMVDPYDKTVFGANYVSNVWDSETGKGIITFDGEITMISEKAFYGNKTDCNKLTSVAIPNSVTSIGRLAFGYCSKLTSITIPDSVTSIEDYAFFDCSNLTSVTIPNSVTTIGNYAFGGCYSLTSVTIPDSVTTIGYQVFSKCSKLKEFNGKFAADGGRCLIVDSTIIAYAIASGTTYTIPDNVTSVGRGAFYYCGSLTDVTIGNNVTTIENNAFDHCTGLISMNIPNSVTTIGDYAFYHCENLASVTNGKNVKSIGEWAFGYCFSLTDVIIPDSVTSIGDKAFYNCNHLANVIIGNGVTTIGVRAFSDCYNLANVTIGNSVTTIGGSAFSDCWDLTSVTIGNSVTTIGESAFARCSSLTSITIPDSVTTIGGSAFNSCSSLACVTIPDSVTTIGGYAFNSCSSLACVYCKPTTPPKGSWDMFSNNATDRKIYVPASGDDSIINAYKAAYGWKSYSSSIFEDESL